ncbi:unnamed protein product [Lactuca virosa]|uniref:Uncharacterized protein n=1 Tax=Lactuca virosa TaxID=75947 RepID=A0AAU9MDY3_9ASTR|nr:unnamed protein product [Lactuca virosa]
MTSNTDQSPAAPIEKMPQDPVKKDMMSTLLNLIQQHRHNAYFSPFFLKKKTHKKGTWAIGEKRWKGLRKLI